MFVRKLARVADRRACCRCVPSRAITLPLFAALCWAQTVGVQRLGFWWVFRYVVLPHVVVLVLLTCPPHAVARWIIPRFYPNIWQQYMWFEYVSDAAAALSHTHSLSRVHSSAAW